MGRREHSERLQKSDKSVNQHNLTNPDLRECVNRLLKLSTDSIPLQSNSNTLLSYHNDLSVIIDKIKLLETQQSDNGSMEYDYDRISNDKLVAFTDWLKSNGAIFNGCSIADFPGYDLGLKADVDVTYGTLFIAVPTKLMMRIESAKKSILKNLISKHQILKDMENVTMAIYLLVEKFKNDSFYKPYIDILPRSYSTVLYFSTEELKELKGSPTLELAVGLIKNICRQYAYFHIMFDHGDDPVSRLLKPHFTFEEYCWAVSTIMTRQNTIPGVDGINQTALVPLWDLLNHTQGKISTDYNPVLKRIECLALRDFKCGEQLFIFYGPRSNGEFFIHNGFVPDNNEYDNYNIKLGISKSDPLKEKRSLLLQKISLANIHQFRLKKDPVQIPQNLVAFVRIFCMDEDQLNHWLESDNLTDLGYEECTVDLALEKKSWIFLQTRLKLILAAYKTTVDEDLSQLNENKLPPNISLALKMRYSEKVIIRDNIEWLKQRIEQ